MKIIGLLISLAATASPLYASTPQDDELRNEIKQLQRQSRALQMQLNQLQHRLIKQTATPAPEQEADKAKHSVTKNTTIKNKMRPTSKHKQSHARHPTSNIGKTTVYAHTLKGDPDAVELYPTALLSKDNHVITYIAGTPIISVPYLGSRPAFDGSDYIVNISSINRDIRLMEQRRKLYQAFNTMGYPAPDIPIIALSGKAEPVGNVGDSFRSNVNSNWNLGSAELDVAAAVNHDVEAYLSLAYDPSPYAFNNWSVANSPVGLGMGFINIGNLETTPYYLTAGQIYVPFGRYSSSMISAPLTMMMSRTKARPVIFGYKSQTSSGPFAALYGFKGDTTLGNSGVGGANLGYIFSSDSINAEIGASFINSIANAAGMQANGSTAGATFGGFSSITNGNEAVKAIPAFDVHANLRFDRYIFTAEWVTATEPFRPQDLSFNNRGAQPQAAQLEAAATFIAFDKPASFAIGYQWSKETLAMNIPKQRANAAFNLSIWKDTVETIEYRHDVDFRKNQYANGAAPAGAVNATTYGTGESSNMVLAQIGVYF